MRSRMLVHGDAARHGAAATVERVEQRRRRTSARNRVIFPTYGRGRYQCHASNRRGGGGATSARPSARWPCCAAARRVACLQTHRHRSDADRAGGRGHSPRVPPDPLAARVPTLVLWCRSHQRLDSLARRSQDPCDLEAEQPPKSANDAYGPDVERFESTQRSAQPSRRARASAWTSLIDRIGHDA